MKFISRRSFLGLSLGYGILAGCAKHPSDRAPLSLGPLAKFSEGKTALDLFRVEIIRSGVEVRAISLLCTHQTCLLSSDAEGYGCPCHGSRFSAKGEKLSGPAPTALPWFELSVSSNGELLLHRDKRVGPEWSLKIS